MTLLLIGIGLTAGVAAGLFGIGGGILVVPALVFLANFSQEKATGTSLAVLLPPVGILACLEYYRHGNVDLRAAALIALGLVAGAYLGALGAQKADETWMKVSFGVFVIFTGAWIIISALKNLHLKGL